MTKRIFIIAGPNGSGKTTTALSMQPEIISIYEFINADEIARGLAPLHPERMALTASKLMVGRLRDLLSKNKSFAFETTAAGTNYIKYIQEAHKKNYEINLMYLWLSSSDLAVKRVAQRVAEGGHHVPEDTIRRRYKTGLKNIMKLYLPLSHTALILDNSREVQTVIARKNKMEALEILNLEIWEEMRKSANE